MSSQGSATVRAVLASTHGQIAAGVPRWAVRAAYAATLTVLPSCLWRIAAIPLHGPLLERTTTPARHHGPVLFTGAWYAVALSLVSESLAYLTVGLVSEWGETVPRWIPGLGGRRVPVGAAVIPAAFGAVVLTVLFPYTLVMLSLGRMVDGTRGVGLVVHGWQAVVFAVAYAPLAAWGPLLGIVTVNYYRRRGRATRSRDATLTVRAPAGDKRAPAGETHVPAGETRAPAGDS